MTMEIFFKLSFWWAACRVGILLLCFGLESLATAGDGLLTNGHFEDSPDPNFLNATVIVGETVLPGWKTEGNVEYITAGQVQGPKVPVVPQGRHAVRLGNDGQISQGIELDRGSVYAITFGGARTCSQLETLNVSVPPISGIIDLQTEYSGKGWDAYAWGFRADSRQAKLVFLNPGMEDDPACGPVIDSVAIKKVSAPNAPNDQNLVKNGDFESGPWILRYSSLGVLIPPTPYEDWSPVPHWMVEAGKAVRYVDSDHFWVPEGNRAIQLLSGMDGSIVQSIYTVSGNTYSLSFLLGEAGDSCREPMAVMASAANRSQDFKYSTSSRYQKFNMSFLADSEITRIGFYSMYYNTKIGDNSSLCGPVIDAVRVTDLGQVNSAGSISGLSFSLLCYCANLLALVFIMFFQ